MFKVKNKDTRKAFGSQCANESRKLLNSTEKHFCPTFLSLWAKLSLKKNFLARSEILKLLFNTLTADAIGVLFVFLVNFKHISHLVLMFLLLTLNMYPVRILILQKWAPYLNQTNRLLSFCMCGASIGYRKINMEAFL